MRLVGVENADERLLFRLVQIYAWTSEQWEIPQADILTYMDNVQAYIKSVPRNKNIAYIEHYPETAELLDTELKQLIYADGNVPVPIQAPELGNILAGNKMRGRKSGKQQIPKWVEGVPDELRATVLAAINKASSSSSSTSAPAVQPTPAPFADAAGFTQDTFRFSARQHVKPEVAIKKEPADKCTADTAPDDDYDNGTSDDGKEQQASPEDVDALTANLLAARTNLRAKASMKKEPKMKRPAPATMKRPAAAKAVVAAKTEVKMKRPAACKIRPKNIGTWKNIHSMIYHRKRLEVFKKTGSDAKAKAAASAEWARARVRFIAGTLNLPE